MFWMFYRIYWHIINRLLSYKIVSLDKLPVHKIYGFSYGGFPQSHGDIPSDHLQKHSWLVVEPSLLKNDGVRQFWWIMPNVLWKKKNSCHVPNISKPLALILIKIRQLQWLKWGILRTCRYRESCRYSCWYVLIFTVSYLSKLYRPSSVGS